MEISIVRNNIKKDSSYRPYCGSKNCLVMPRTVKDGDQFRCMSCGWRSSFDEEFSSKYIRVRKCVK